MNEIIPVADEINRLHIANIKDMGNSLVRAIRIGELLTKQKASLAHGDWLPWIEGNVPFDRTQASRYMKVYSRRDELNVESAQHLTGAVKSLCSPKTVHVSHNSGENEWYTPPKFIDAAKEVMGGVDVDPASSKVANDTVQATKYYDTESDGLKKKWTGRVWMNPPYSQPHISRFCDTLADKLETGEVTEACVLVNNATETAFGQRLLSLCQAVCFPSGRIKFLDVEGEAKGAPLQGQMILYFGVHSQHFIAQFVKFGACLYHG